MIKQALYSYIAAITPKNMKEKKVREQYGSLFIWLFYIPIFIGFKEGSAYAIGILIGALPLIFMMWSNFNSKYMMSKSMYLCPMSDEERKEYIHAVIVIKIGVPLLLSLLLNLIYSCFYGFQIINILLRLFMTISFGIAIYVCQEGRNKKNRSILFAKKNKKGNIVTSYLNMFNCLLCCVFLVTFAAFDYESIEKEGTYIIMGIWLTMIVLFDVLIIKYQYKDVIESQGDYERNFLELDEILTY